MSHRVFSTRDGRAVPGGADYTELQPEVFKKRTGFD
jgi:hypothetical protein